VTVEDVVGDGSGMTISYRAVTSRECNNREAATSSSLQASKP